MGLTQHSAAKKPQAYLLESLLHVGFALTGAGTVLLGCILPQASAQWHLQDKDAGLLLMVQFASSATGALLVRRNVRKALGFGYALFSAGAVGVFLQHLGFPIRALAFAIYGLGLGLAMTSTNMLFGKRYPERRGSALALLNFSWSAGALSCPLVVSHYLGHNSSGAAFGLVGILAVLFVALPLLAPSLSPAVETGLREPEDGSSEWRIIVYFATLAFLYVGIEATVGNWLSTYATRATAWNFAGSGLTVAVFWAALLVGRAFTPAMLFVTSETRLHRLSVLTILAGIALLLVAHNPTTLIAGSALTGLALAPVFPLILSLFLTEIGESKHAGWVFAVAGFGGATLSWLTGTLSTAAGSLRIALMVPWLAALLMIAMIVGSAQSKDQ